MNCRSEYEKMLREQVESTQEALDMARKMCELVEGYKRMFEKARDMLVLERLKCAAAVEDIKLTVDNQWGFCDTCKFKNAPGQVCSDRITADGKNWEIGCCYEWRGLGDDDARLSR